MNGTYMSEESQAKHKRFKENRVIVFTILNIMGRLDLIRASTWQSRLAIEFCETQNHV